MELFVFVLGILIGGLIHLGTNKLFRFKRNSLREDRYKQILQEWQVSFPIEKERSFNNGHSRY